MIDNEDWVRSRDDPAEIGPHAPAPARDDEDWGPVNEDDESWFGAGTSPPLDAADRGDDDEDLDDAAEPRSIPLVDRDELLDELWVPEDPDWEGRDRLRAARQGRNLDA